MELERWNSEIFLRANDVIEPIFSDYLLIEFIVNYSWTKISRLEKNPQIQLNSLACPVFMYAVFLFDDLELKLHINKSTYKVVRPLLFEKCFLFIHHTYVVSENATIIICVVLNERKIS